MASKRMNKADRRIQLLSIAREIVEEDGITGLTMSALVEKSGAVRPVVYEHFDNAEAVAIAIVDEYFQSTAKFVIEALKEASTIAEYMDRLVDALFDHCQKTGFNIRQWTNGFASPYPNLNRVVREFNVRATNIYASLLLDQGVSKELCESSGFAIYETVSATVYEFALGPNAEPARRSLKILLGAMIKALVPVPGPKPVIPDSLIAPLV